MKDIKEITQEDAEFVLKEIDFLFNVGGRMERECAIAFFEQAAENWAGNNWNISPDKCIDLIKWAKEKGYKIPDPLTNPSLIGNKKK